MPKMPPSCDPLADRLALPTPVTVAAATARSIDHPQTQSNKIEARVQEIIRLHGECLCFVARSLDAAIRVGELLVEQKAALPHGKFIPWIVENLPFDERTAQRYMKISRNRGRLKSDSVSALTEAHHLLAEGKTARERRIVRVIYSTRNNDWNTPAQIIQRVKKVMGRIDLDPASSEIANAIVGAERFFTEEDESLKQEWKGSIFLNPPYSIDLIGLFCRKMKEEIKKGNVAQAIVVVNNTTETKWFHNLASVFQCCCFHYGRIRFWNAQKESTTPLQGQVILYYGPNQKSFFSTFGEIGWCCKIVPS